MESATAVLPALTTLRVDKEYMGRKAVQKLMEILQSTGLPCEKSLISTRLIERESVKKFNMRQYNSALKLTERRFDIVWVT